MGSVWAAQNTQLEAPVAVKFMAPDAVGSPELVARFQREAKAAAQIRSPHVVQIFEHGMHLGLPFIVMELLEGEDLGSRLRRAVRLSLAETCEVVTQVCKALRRAHEMGIVHRDLKPANVFLARHDEDEVVKVLDFGIAKSLAPAAEGDDASTQTGTLVGTPHYMSPEQAQRSKQIDARSDLWSLGVIAFRAVTGRVPFKGDDLINVLVKVCTEPAPVPSSIAPELGPEVDAFFARALCRDLDGRFQSAREMSDAFAALLGRRSLSSELSLAAFVPPSSPASLRVPPPPPSSPGSGPAGPPHVAPAAPKPPPSVPAPTSGKPSALSAKPTPLVSAPSGKPSPHSAKPPPSVPAPASGNLSPLAAPRPPGSPSPLPAPRISVPAAPPSARRAAPIPASLASKPAAEPTTEPPTIAEDAALTEAEPAKAPAFSPAPAPSSTPAPSSPAPSAPAPSSFSASPFPPSVPPPAASFPPSRPSTSPFGTLTSAGAETPVLPASLRPSKTRAVVVVGGGAAALAILVALWSGSTSHPPPTQLVPGASASQAVQAAGSDLRPAATTSASAADTAGATAAGAATAPPDPSALPLASPSASSVAALPTASASATAAPTPSAHASDARPASSLKGTLPKGTAAPKATGAIGGAPKF